MRLLHVADCHFGLLTHSRPDPETGLPSRLLDVVRCWEAAVGIARDRVVDAVIVAGDIFHGPNPDAAALNAFAVGLGVLRSNEIPTVLIAGNHDRAPHANRHSVLEVFDDPPRVWAVTAPEIVEVAGLRVACLPSVSRHQLMAGREGISRQDADQAVVDGLRRIIDRYRAEGADVLTGHWPVAGAVLGSERDIAIIDEPMLDLADVEGPWKLAAFGHIHSAQELRVGDTSFAYSGSIERMNFGEEHDAKVALEWDLSYDVLSSIPHELPARGFLTLDYPDSWDPEPVIDAVVRLRGVPPRETETFRRWALDAGAHQVVIEVARPETVPVGAATVTEALGPLEALEEFLRLKDIPEEQRPELRDRAKQLAEEAV